MQRSVDVDQVTDEVFRLLLGNPSFVQKVEDRTKEVLEVDDESPSSNSSKLEIVIMELVKHVDLATQALLDNINNFFHTEQEHNRSASFLYDAIMLISRLEKFPNIQRADSCTRRLSQLCRQFSLKFSSRSNSINLVHMEMFASSLCDMLYRLDTVLLVLEVDQKLVQRAATDFNNHVVKRLNLMLLKSTEKEKVSSKPAPFLTPKPPRRRPLIQVQGRSPGFLMSPELIKDRQRIKRTRSLSSNWTRPSSTVKSTSRTRIEKVNESLIGRLHNKWSKLLVAEQSLRKSVSSTDEDDEQMKIAKRVSADVMRQLRQQIGPKGLVALE